MTFELDAEAGAHRAAAEAAAREVVAPAAPDVDRSADVPEALREALRAVLPAGTASDWVVAVEALAAASPTLALVAAGEALGTPAVAASAQWTGLRGADVDGLRTALAADVRWHLAVTATLVGAARAAVEAAVSALKTARAAGQASPAGQPLVVDAATAVDASRLLLWDAAGQATESTAAGVARGLARGHALDSLASALAAAEQACGAEAFRPGTALERLRRDAATAALVLGDRVLAADAVAAGTFQG